MPKMRGLGKDPLGRYGENLIFDLPDEDPGQVEDFVAKGWAEVLPEEEHPGRTVTQIAASMVRGDELSDPTEAKIAADLEGREHAIVHLDDPDATEDDYDAEVSEGREAQRPARNAITADSLGGVPAKGGSGGGGSSGSSSSRKAKKEEAPAEEPPAAG